MERTEQIQDEHAVSITNAMTAAGLGTDWTLVNQLHGGLSTSTLYHITADERHYAVRVTVPDDHHNDLGREYAVMQTLNPLDIAPHVYYVNAESGVAIADFIEGAPLLPWSADRPPFMPMLAAAIRTLHNGSTLPPATLVIDKAKTAIRWLPDEWAATPWVTQATALLAPLEPFLRDPAYLRSIHGDLNPGNMLFDGTRLWLIDWTEAGQDNFYVDLACAATFFFHRSEALELEFLQSYFERPPTDAEVAAYKQALVFCAIYLGLVFLYMSAQQGTLLLPSTEIDALPDYATFMARFGRDEESVANPLSQQRIGFVYMQRAVKLWGELAA